MSACKIHNVRFYKPKPRAIYCMALKLEDKKLAISRSNASLEIWNLNNCPYIERSIAPNVENFSIEGLAWCKNRLFSVGLHGLLVEYDLFKLAIKNRSAVTGEAAYCLDICESKNEIAIGTEQGYVNIFDITTDGVLFNKFLDKQEGRIICCKYDSSGEHIVCGSIDAIRIWNVKSGHAIHKMTLGRSEANKPTIVWCLAITQDFTILSGDSRGVLTFWDGKIGSQIESYKSHRADILSLCLSKDENSLNCAGVDPSITNYVRINVKEGTKKWVKSVQRKIHDHDVRAMVICDNKLYSSGVDGYLACSFYPPKTLYKIPPIMQNPCVSLGLQARYMLLRYPKYVEIWSLGKSQNTDESYRGLVGLKNEPKKLVVLKKTVKDFDDNEQKEGIICSSISNDGQWIFLSTDSGFRLYHLNCENEEVNIRKMDSIEDNLTPSVQAVFSPHSTQLVVAQNTGKLQIYDVNSDEVSVSQTIDLTGVLTDTVTFLLFSECGKYLVAGDPQSNIIVWTKIQNEWKIHSKLPKYKIAPTAMAIHPVPSYLIVAYADNKIIEYDLKKKCYTNFSKLLEKNMQTQWMSKSLPIRNITFDPRADHVIILHDDSSIIILNTEKEMPVVDAKIPKIDSNQLQNRKNGKESGFYSVKKYKHLVHLSWLSDGEMVAVEVNPLSLIEQLPPAFVQSTFGRK